MAYDLPLPKIIPDVGPGGAIVTSNRGVNALKESSLKNRYAELVNQYYAPNMESEINNRNALTEGQNIHNKYLPEEYRIANNLNQQKFEWNPRNWESQNAYQSANARKTNTMLPLEAENQRNINQWYAKKAQADIDAQNAMAAYRKMGGGMRGSAGTGDEMRFSALVKDYNPDLLPEQLREAGDAYASGQTQLSDGTPLAPMNPTLQRAYDRAFKSTTTAPLITQGVKANAAEAEMPVLDKYISSGRKPYGTTIFGKSPQQIKDSLDLNNKSAQNRLGDYIAADVLTFDKAALQTRIAGTESGVTIIDEVMKKSKQTIDAKYPTLSNAARQRALETVGKALREALAERNKYGIGASRATGNNTSRSSLKPASEMTTAEIQAELANLRNK